MGEVYRARDARLNRDVAIKTLPAHVASDRERTERFQREAQILAALSHPHIAGIYGLEQTGAATCLVLELVDGESLAARLGAGPLPVAEALRIARQIADAVLAAHDKGIVHRDLKPANVMLTADGQAKVLDFGLGKVVEPESARDVSNSPTMTLGATQAGMLLGTAAYMSPEQAKGLAADKRSDVWAFGCVLFEMLTGARAFHGDDVSESLAAVLKSEPGWTALPADTPGPVRALLESCLQKSRRARLADLSAAIFVIDHQQSLAAPTEAAGAPPAAKRSLVRRMLPFAATAVLVAGVLSLGWWALRPVTAAQPTTRFVLALTDEQTFTSSTRPVVAVSPDGSRIVLVGNKGLFVRPIGEFAARLIPGTEGALGPAFSPDGREIAFWSSVNRNVQRINADGGVATTIAPATDVVALSWSRYGLLAANGAGGVSLVATGAAPKNLVRLEPEQSAYGPQFLPGGRQVLFSIANRSSTSQDIFERWRVVAYSLDTGATTLVRDGAGAARYLPTGHLVFAIGGTLYAAPFDLRTLKIAGPEVAVVEGVRRGLTGAAHYDVSDSGVLTYVPGPASTTTPPGGLVIADRTGALEPLPLPTGGYDFPRAAPNGKSIAFELSQAGDASVWVYELHSGSSMHRLTLVGKRNRYPVWSPQSDRIAFQSDREGDLGIFAQRADGTGAVVRLTKADAGVEHIPESWSPNGDYLLFTAMKGGQATLWVVSLRDNRVEPFGGVKSGRPVTAVFSPDGKWVAYSSDADRTEGFVFVQPFPATGEIHQISKDGENGHHPMWASGGKELLFVPQVGRLVVVTISMTPTFTFSDPKPVPRRFAVSNPVTERPWDVTPDGRILSIYDSTLSMTPEIRVVLNWFDELRARVPIR
jgi:serine/threonine-protein kinase